MANEEHLAMLKQGVEKWNKWREENAYTIPALSGAELRGENLRRANLARADLRCANFRRADLSGSYIRWANLREADLSGVDLSGVDLGDADLSEANLSGADLRRANLSGADLSGAHLSLANLKNLRIDQETVINDKWHLVWEIVNQGTEGRHLSGTDLSEANFSEANFSGANFSGADLTEANLNQTNLNQVNLSGANLSRANLSGAKLLGANLSGANLRGVLFYTTQVLATNFKGATFTGACLEDWNINSETNLDDVICSYIYLKQGKQERRPHDPNQNFAPGEFATLVRKTIETVDLIFKDGIDWEVFLTSFRQLQIESESGDLSVQAIEKKPGGAFVIRVEVPTDADKAAIEESFWQKYKPRLEAKDEQIAFYRQEIEYKRKENTRLMGIIETMAERESVELNELEIQILHVIHKGIFKAQEIAERLRKKIEIIEYYLDELKKKQYILGSLTHKAYYCQLTPKGVVAVESPDDLIKEPSMSKTNNNFFAPVGSVDNKGTQINTAGVNEGYQIYNAEQKQNLAQAAAEIQQLLEQLSQTYPTETLSQKAVVAEEAIKQIENDPTLRERVVRAIKAMGVEALMEAIDHPVANVLRAGIEAFKEPTND